ncbi:MAG TPA: hypothetical protein VJZ27_18800 [Aggregatilineales bacterium]|nr:hypothetical protein [Aggregatilineales bacterium]
MRQYTRESPTCQSGKTSGWVSHDAVTDYPEWDWLTATTRVTDWIITRDLSSAITSQIVQDTGGVAS